MGYEMNESQETGGNVEETTQGVAVGSEQQGEVRTKKGLLARLQSGESPIHNFGGTPSDQWRLIAAATGATAKPISENTNVSINLRYWFAHLIELVNQKTGEMTEVPRLVMFDKDGECYSAVSDSLLSQIDNIIASFGEGPYDDIVKFKVVSARTRSGGNIYNVVPQ